MAQAIPKTSDPDRQSTTAGKRDFLHIVEAAAPDAPDIQLTLDPRTLPYRRDAAAMQALLGRLSRAADAWHDPAGGDRRRIQAARTVVQGVFAAVHDQDPDDISGMMAPILALLNALDDIAHDRNPPEWIRPKLFENRPPDGLGEWFVRANAAFRLQQLIDLGMPRPEAQKAVFKILCRHGIRVSQAATVYSWLCKLRRSEAPDRAVHSFNLYRARWRKAPPGGDSEARIRTFLRDFERELEKRGHLSAR